MTMTPVDECLMRQTHAVGVSARRFGLNWLKVRLWELADFDAVLYMDSDVEVLGGLEAVFELPTDFAVAMDPNKKGYSCGFKNKEHF